MDVEFKAAADAILLQNVQDSRPENKIYRQPLSNDRAKWVKYPGSAWVVAKVSSIPRWSLRGKYQWHTTETRQQEGDLRKVHLKTRHIPKAAHSSALNKPIWDTRCAERGLTYVRALMGGAHSSLWQLPVHHDPPRQTGGCYLLSFIKKPEMQAPRPLSGKQDLRVLSLLVPLAPLHLTGHVQ